MSVLKSLVLFGAVVTLGLGLFGHGASGVWLNGRADHYKCLPNKTYLIAVFMNPGPNKLEKTIEINVGVQKFIRHTLDWDKLYTAVDYDINYWNWKIPAKSVKILSQRYMECSAWFRNKEAERTVGVFLKLEQDVLPLSANCHRRDEFIGNTTLDPATAFSNGNETSVVHLPASEDHSKVLEDDGNATSTQVHLPYTEGLTFIRKPKYGQYGSLDIETLRQSDDNEEFLEWVNSGLGDLWEQHEQQPIKSTFDVDPFAGIRVQIAAPFGWEMKKEMNIVVPENETAALYQARAWCGAVLRVDANAVPVHIKLPVTEVTSNETKTEEPIQSTQSASRPPESPLKNLSPLPMPDIPDSAPEFSRPKFPRIIPKLEMPDAPGKMPRGPRRG